MRRASDVRPTCAHSLGGHRRTETHLPTLTRRRRRGGGGAGDAAPAAACAGAKRAAPDAPASPSDGQESSAPAKWAAGVAAAAERRGAAAARLDPPPLDAAALAWRRTAAAWRWKREHLTDKSRFERPYAHPLGAAAGGGTLTLEQAPFGPEGFASTVWDSAIVLAKWMERRGGGAVAGASVVDLSAGVGLVAAVAARLGAAPVAATDLAPNLPLLRRNLDRAAGGGGAARAAVAELRWGDGRAARALGRFDLVLAADVSYVPGTADDLAASLDHLVAPGGAALVAHGRNRGEWGAIRAAAAARGLQATLMDEAELHPDYVAVDVDVWRLARAPEEGRRSS